MSIAVKIDEQSHFRKVIENDMMRERTLDNVRVEDFFSRMNLCDVLKPGMKVLELGCGNGKILKGLADEYGIKPYGIDLADFIGKQNISYRDPCFKKRVRFKVGNIQQVPYKDNRFDFVFSFMCFMYLTDKLKGLAECHRVMKPGASALIDIKGDMVDSNTLIHPSLKQIVEKYPNENQISLRGFFGSLDPVIDKYCRTVIINKTSSKPLVFPGLAAFDYENDIRVNSFYEL